MTLTKTVRQVTGNAIDEAVDWLTVEASWLFSSLSDGVTYALILIEDVLKWIPWPVIVLGLALLSFAVGRWSLLGFTTAALLVRGFMGLWENTLDTIALMVVSVVVSVTIGLPLGVLAARNQLFDNIMRPIPGRDADDAELRVPASGWCCSSDLAHRRECSRRSSTPSHR